MLTIDLKQKIKEGALSVLSEKISSLQAELSDITAGFKNESKSSAGDKHETSRAMAQLEQEKLQKQLAELHRQQEALQLIESPSSHTAITTGSLIQTDKGLFFLSIPLGKLMINNREVMIISPQSPIGNIFLSGKTGETFVFNNTHYSILEII